MGLSRNISPSTRGDAQDGLVGPLALGFDAEVASAFLEGDFDLPTPGEAGHTNGQSPAKDYWVLA